MRGEKAEKIEVSGGWIAIRATNFAEEGERKLDY